MPEDFFKVPEKKDYVPQKLEKKGAGKVRMTDLIGAADGGEDEEELDVGFEEKVLSLLGKILAELKRIR